ncbi:MAG: GAF domain-containing protein [Anaerolineae bacterium]
MNEIGTRLTVTFIALVLVVAVVVSATSILLGVRTVRQHVYNELETDVVLKQQALETWVDQLTLALQSLVVEDYEVERAQTILFRTSTYHYRLQARQQLRTRLADVIDRTQWFSEIFLIDNDGVVVLSTDLNLEGRSVAHRDYFEQGALGSYLETPHYDPIVDGVSAIFARPLKFGDYTYGVLAGRVDVTQLNRIVRVGVASVDAAAVASPAGGKARTTHLVGRDYMLLTEPILSAGFLPVHSQAIDSAMMGQETVARGAYRNHRGVPVLGVYTWVPDLEIALVSEVPRSEVLAGARMTSLVNAAVAVIAAVVAVAAALYFSRDISGSLSELADTATRIAEGELDLVAEIEREDEIGALAQAFNAMTAQLHDLIGGLEQRVQERTRGLQAVTEVSRATTSILDPVRLLPRVVDLVRERFDLYYVGLFLIDEEREDAVLRAGTGEAGAEMLAQGWRLAVGGRSMIGQCTKTGEPQILQSSEDEVARFVNPLLPETRSELALPLRYGGRIIGAMTVQSVESRAFDEATIAVLQNLADQVAVAVQNASLFAETQAALDRARRLQRQYQIEAWSAYMELNKITGYERRGAQVQPLGDTILREVEDGLELEGPAVEEGRLRIPLMQGDQVMGVLGLERARDWTDEELALVESLVEQLTLTAETQRLLDDISRRAALEQTVGQMTARIRAEAAIESVLERALAELGNALDAERGAALLTLDGTRRRDREAGERGKE